MSADERARTALPPEPSVDRLAVELARSALAERRTELLRGASDTGEDVDLVQRALGRLRPSLRPVINATGVVIHDGLGRAPLAPAASAAAVHAAGYSNLELDLERGERASRHAHVERLLCELTGAQAGIAVNNGAGAVLLAVTALAGAGRGLVVSSGDLPGTCGQLGIGELLAQSGARLVEVGNTNGAGLEDYRSALGPATGALLRVHRPNPHAAGSVDQVEIEPLCAVGPPVIDDIGSGVLSDTFLGGDHEGSPADEPSARRSIAGGAALVCFSGDRLLGGPQAGLLVGRADAVAAARSHPLARALRIDKLSLAALEATLALHRDPELARREIPALAMLLVDERVLHDRAQRLAHETGGRIVQVEAPVGGAALPLPVLSGPAVALEGGSRRASELIDELRAGEPAVLARVRDDAVVLDPRTLTDAQIADVAQAVRAARRRLGGA